MTHADILDIATHAKRVEVQYTNTNGVCMLTGIDSTGTEFYHCLSAVNFRSLVKQGLIAYDATGDPASCIETWRFVAR